VAEDNFANFMEGRQRQARLEPDKRQNTNPYTSNEKEGMQDFDELQSLKSRDMIS